MYGYQPSGLSAFVASNLKYSLLRTFGIHSPGFHSTVTTASSLPLPPHTGHSFL